MSFKKPDTMAGPIARLTSPTGLAVAVLISITLAFYHKLWLPGLVLIKRDAFWFHLPTKQYLIDRLASGELPQWFPYEALGRPFIGATVTGVFHPFTALYFLLPVTDAYRASTLLSCLLAALGAFALGRTLELSRAGSLIAGIAFTLSGYVSSLTDNIVYLYSICALPLFCAALEKALAGARAWTVAPALIWATVFLNGDVQTGYYFGFIALLWALARAPGPYRESLLRLALVLCLSCLLAGVQLGPAAMTFVGSDRAQPELFQDWTLRWSTHPLRFITMLAAPIGEDANPQDMGRFFFGNPKFGMWAESLYLGMPVMGLAIIGAWGRRNLRVLVLLGSLALWLSLGRYGGLYQIFSQAVPLWSAFRYPEKLMGFVAFAAAMLAGAGFDVLRARKNLPAPWLVTALLCASAVLGLRMDATSAWAAAHFGAPEALALEVTSTAARAFLFTAFAALGVWVLVLGGRRGWLREAFLLPLLATIITLDLARANFVAYHTGPVETATFIPPLAEALQAREGKLQPGRFRLISINEEQVMLPRRVQHRLGYEGAWSVARRQALDLAHNAQMHIESPYVYLPGYSATLASTLKQKSGLESAARYNVAYYVGSRLRLQYPIFANALVADLPDFDLALFQNPVPVKPRAYLSRHPERADSRVDPIALIARPDFLNGEVDVIETSGAPLPDPAEAGAARIERYAPEEVRVRVETPQPAVLVLLDAYDKGWTATIENGAALPILRANALVRAVVVPAGEHMVTFSYQTPLLKAGAWASSAGVLLCVGLLAHARWRTHVNRSSPPVNRTVDT